MAERDGACKLSESEVVDVIEHALTAARPKMKRSLGTSPKGYDAADEIAVAVAGGIRAGLEKYGLA